MLVFTKIARRKIKMTEKMKLRMERMTTNVNACLMDTIWPLPLSLFTHNHVLVTLTQSNTYTPLSSFPSTSRIRIGPTPIMDGSRVGWALLIPFLCSTLISIQIDVITVVTNEQGCNTKPTERLKPWNPDVRLRVFGAEFGNSINTVPIHSWRHGCHLNMELYLLASNVILCCISNRITSSFRIP